MRRILTDDIHSQVVDVIELFRNTVQISSTIIVAVFETRGVDFCIGRQV